MIFFGQNVSSAAQLRSAVATLRSAQQASPVHQPLLLMTDQEGGIVRRVPGAPLQSAKEIGATGDPAQAAAAGSAAGVNLRGLGLNLNLAPVLDVYHSPGDFADSAQRSFSSDPATVASMGSAFIRAQQQAGAAATAKHFRGWARRAAPRTPTWSR
ncbi:glycoside hydrolase family 3 N-terminal domain-containing protein [Streptacidiphilus monticola]